MVRAASTHKGPSRAQPLDCQQVEDKGALVVLLGVLALGLYGIVAAYQPDPNVGRVLAAYGGVFIVGSLVWGIVFDGFRPDRFDLVGAAVCLIGVGVIMYAPRGAW